MKTFKKKKSWRIMNQCQAFEDCQSHGRNLVYMENDAEWEHVCDNDFKDFQEESWWIMNSCRRQITR
jgi:hypothetical protein